MNIDYPNQLFNGFLHNNRWNEASAYFDSIMGHLVWWFLDPSAKKIQLLRKPKGKALHCPGFSKEGQKELRLFIKKLLKDKTEHFIETKSLCSAPYYSMIYPLRHERDFCGALLICHIKKDLLSDKAVLNLFELTINSILDEIYKELELNRLYKTLRPRAVALSTVHTIHRIIGSTMTVRELLPKVARLCLQILKVEGCSIFICNEKKNRLVPQVTVGPKDKNFLQAKNISVKVAKSGVYHIEDKVLAVPLLNEDVIGCIAVYKKINNEVFSVADQEILLTLAEQTTIAIENARLYEEQQKMMVGTVKSLVRMLNFISPKTFTHSGRFVDIVMALAKELDVSVRERNALNYAAVLHDAGEIGISNKILNKAVKLNKHEVKIIRTHPASGVSIIEPIEILKPVVPLVLHHHERYDGRGYPDGLKGTQIPIGARIMAVADAFEAMISERSYRDPKGIKEAVAEIRRCSGAQFDPKVVEAFLSLCEKGIIQGLLGEKIKKI